MSNFTKSKQNVNHWMSSLSILSCKVQSNDPKIEEIFSRMYQWLIFFDIVYSIHYDASPSALFTNQVLSAHSLSRTVVLVLRAGVNQAKDFFMSAKLIDKLPNVSKGTHPCI